MPGIRSLIKWITVRQPRYSRYKSKAVFLFREKVVNEAIDKGLVAEWPATYMRSTKTWEQHLYVTEAGLAFFTGPTTSEIPTAPRPLSPGGCKVDLVPADLAILTMKRDG